MNRLNLFDSFCISDLDNEKTNHLEKSITNNIKDILQNKATIGLEKLPFNFGIKDLSGITIFGEDVKLQLESYIEERIKTFEPRILLISVKIVQPKTYGDIVVEVIGRYEINNNMTNYHEFFDL